ncbi:MAG: hypothetical protein E6Q36_05765 [Chryseobacterium sp.]|nr:MAG: hypothetical protein E6Q36_05765 [Chryseobacterium sp.]
MFPEKQRAYLLEKLGLAAVEQLEADMEARRVAGANIPRKDYNGGNMDEQVKNAIDQIRQSLNLDGLNESIGQVQKSLDAQVLDLAEMIRTLKKGVEQLGQEVSTLRDELAVVKKSTDDRLTEMLSAETPYTINWQTPPKDETVGQELSALKQAMASETWLSALDPRK